ncbi:flagellar export chaperone FlgN [Vallitalea guaymasensis]|uniref:flagellar export chaperone FlgN n=1 Tax=Vallitalea guaymasensis TaxID=1185412 RepID=UPI000DE32813|nr:flagellar export chaperone FlgN [Vallitalea guaymasensis]
MSDINTYLNILLDSLDKKSDVLKNIYEVTRKQSEYVNNNKFDLEEFNEFMAEKQKYIEEIAILDSGFQSTFDRISNELEGNVHLYKDKIKLLKNKITSVSEIGIDIQVLEEKNKVIIEEHFNNKKREIKTFKKSKKTATNYYKNMNNSFKDKSYFLDQKK